MSTRQLAYVFSSDPANGALNQSADGSSFSVSLNTPLSIPAAAKHATLEVISASIWWTVPNISITLGNNKIYVHYAAADYVVTIANGLYNLDQLASAISRGLVNLGLPSDILIWTGDASTQRVVVQFTYADSWLDFNPADTMRSILGFDSRLVPLVGQSQGWSETGDSVASFDTISSFMITSDIISQGIPTNSIGRGAIANVLIDVAPGSLINYQPYNAIPVNAHELIGKSKSNFNFQLRDQNGVLADTNSEYYSFTVVIKYFL